MDDDDLADSAQRLLDTLDAFLQNGRLRAQLARNEDYLIRLHRARVAKILDAYRLMHGGMTRRIRSLNLVPSGPMRGYPVSVAMGATLALPWAGIGGSAGGGVAALRLVAIEVLWPVAVAVLLLKLGGIESIGDVLGPSLQEATNALAKVLLSLGAIAAVAITAAEAAKLTLDELLKKLGEAEAAIFNAASAAAARAALSILLEELARRFIECAAAGLIEAVKKVLGEIAKVQMRISRTWEPGALAGLSRRLKMLLQELQDAWRPLRACINLHRRA